MSYPDSDQELDEAVVTKRKTRTSKPPLFKVLLHNDDYTTMEFVIHVLKSVFGKSDPDAVRITLQVHLEGIGVAGVYTYEVAEMKVIKVTTLARAREYPLMTTIEPEG